MVCELYYSFEKGDKSFEEKTGRVMVLSNHRRPHWIGGI